ncbi:MAG: STAS domain-containing protein, partial [Bdellovibrionales bacterium]|nr:STAS domain-containing protein [Bdellovibrionales bacterium]
IVKINGRVDAFNFEAFCQEILPFARDFSRLFIFEASRLEFLGLRTMKLLGEIAADRSQHGRRPFLISPSEKLKKQIAIYADIEDWEVFRNFDEFQRYLENPPAQMGEVLV